MLELVNPAVPSASPRATIGPKSCGWTARKLIFTSSALAALSSTEIVSCTAVPGPPAMLATTKAFLDHFNLSSLDALPPLAELRAMEPEPTPVQDDELPVPAGLQARADVAGADEEGGSPAAGEISFRTLLAELDEMEQGLKTDFDDLLEETVESSEGADEEDPSFEPGR